MPIADNPGACSNISIYPLKMIQNIALTVEGESLYSMHPTPGKDTVANCNETY